MEIPFYIVSLIVRNIYRMVIAMPSTHSPEPVVTSGGESSANEHDNDLKAGQSQCNRTTVAIDAKDNRNNRKEKKSVLSLCSL